MKSKMFFAAFILFSGLLAKAQDKTTLGIGLGFDYGGIGANLTTYAGKNFGLFGGLGMPSPTWVLMLVPKSAWHRNQEWRRS